MQVRTVRCESSITERSVLIEDTHRDLPIVSNAGLFYRKYRMASWRTYVLLIQCVGFLLAGDREHPVFSALAG